MRWRLLNTPPLGAAENMAWDEALLARAASTGEAVFRVYAWSSPTLSLGRNQPARHEYDETLLRRRGIDVVRRLTGGRAVLHDREVTYSVTAPDTFGGTLRGAYQRINEVLMAGLRALGIDAALAAPRGRAPVPSSAPCFEEPTEGELVLGARKLAGSAQYREGGAMLQHGSILIEDDQAALTSFLRTPGPAPSPAGTLSDALGRVPAFGEVASALFGALREREDARATDLVADRPLRDAVAAASERYRDAGWTWRR
jgi:lipoate-protein ligase A